MYPVALATALRAKGIDACTTEELGLTGSSDTDLFKAAVEQGYALLSENVSDFARISADHLTTGNHHPGVLIALSSRFSRRPAGISRLVTAISAVASEQLDDRFVYLKHADPK
jgi:hypothetical protein